MKIPKIILARPKLVVNVKCPKCQSIHIQGIPNFQAECKNCKKIFITEVKVDIYYSIAKQLNKFLRESNEVWIVGERDNSKVFHPEDVLAPRSSHEADIWYTMLAIKKDFEGMKCWEVSDITNEVDQDYLTYCNECGHCHNCVTCSKCKKPYIPKIIKKQKRFTCPDCQNKKYEVTKTKGDKCEFCKSTNISKTKFSAEKKQCPRCKTKNIKEPRKITIYKLIIKRQRRFYG